ncbi:hypothetical protein D3C80_2193200 [compost metagenome]
MERAGITLGPRLSFAAKMNDRRVADDIIHVHCSVADQLVVQIIPGVVVIADFIQRPD